MALAKVSAMTPGMISCSVVLRRPTAMEGCVGSTVIPVVRGRKAEKEAPRALHLALRRESTVATIPFSAIVLSRLRRSSMDVHRGVRDQLF